MKRVKRHIQTLYFVTDARREAVRTQITLGSRPSAVYYVLLGLSVLIAGFGLVADSPAVVIGAMLVSPLMTPIFGVALGLTIGDAHLLRIALVSMIGGVILAILLGAAIGFIPLEGGVTPEIMARTHPTLLDLLVATFAGLAGCIATLNEEVSPILPGIAIATALVPPLAACGLCLAMGAYAGAWGAFLLFFANVLAIFFVAALSFLLAGFTPPWARATAKGMAKRFSVALIGLLAVAGLLTNSLIDIAYRREVDNTVWDVLSEEVLQRTRGILTDTDVDIQPDRITVLGQMSSAKVPPPQVVKEMQHALQEALKKPVDLYVSCQLTRFVSSSGATSLVLGRDNDGGFLFVNRHSRIGITELAEQTLREHIGDIPGLIIEEVDVQEGPWGRTVLVSAQSLHKPPQETAAKLEKYLQKRLDDPNLRLVILRQPIEQISPGKVSVRQVKSDKRMAGIRLVMERRTAELINAIPGMWANEVQADEGNKTWTISAQVNGLRLVTPQEAGQVEAALAEEAGQPVKLVLWSTPAVTVTPRGYRSENDFLRARQKTK